MINNSKFNLNYNIYYCARIMIKTNTISSCQNKKLSNKNGN